MDFILGILIGVVGYHVLSNPQRRAHFFSLFKCKDNGNSDNKS